MWPVAPWYFDKQAMKARSVPDQGDTLEKRGAREIREIREREFFFAYSAYFAVKIFRRGFGQLRLLTWPASG